MTKIKLDKDTVAMWAICEAIGKERHKIKEMEVDKNGYYKVTFSVGGVELDFERVVNRMDEVFCNMVEKKAQDLLVEKYENLIKEIYDIEERIESQKKLFKYDYE